MQIVFDAGTAERELDLRLHDPDARITDLLDALEPDLARAVRGIVVDDRFIATEVTVAEAGLYEGARLRAATGPPSPTGPAAATVIDVVGGLRAGSRVAFTGQASIGRAPDNTVVLEDETVSLHHAELTTGSDGSLIITDLGSHNGTWVDGQPVVDRDPVPAGVLVQLGATQLVVRSPELADRPVATDPARHVGVTGTMPFNRRPRPARPPAATPMALPQPPAEGTSSLPVNVIAVLAPLVFGLVMVIVFDNLLFAMFALLSPVMLIGTNVESRRRGKRTRRAEGARFERELQELTGALAVAGRSEGRRLDAAVPDPAEVLRRAGTPSVTLWERRPTDDDFLLLRAGIGDVPWSPPTPSGPGPSHPDITAALKAGSIAPRAPVPLDLSGGAVLGVVGERRAALAVVRSLLLQAAVHHGPADLAVAVCAQRARDWDWVKWLPHTLDPGGSGRRLLAGDPMTSDGLLRALLDLAGSDAAERTQVLLALLDDESLTEGRRSPARNVLQGHAGPVAGIVIAATEDRLPAVCTAVIDVGDIDGEAALHLPQQGERLERFLATGLTEGTAREGARALARFEDPELDLAGSGLPGRVALLSLLGLLDPDPAEISRRWRDAGPDPAPATPLGVADDGVFTVDLGLDGPHGLVAGTTGSGKSELLRSLVAGLAANVGPEHLTFVLIDFKGGSAFDECARLPHTVGLVTDLDEHLGERALRCLEAELRHRERSLRAHGAGDLAEYRRSVGRDPLPRLVVIIDEFATLATELPDFIDALVGIAQRGRSLGVHLILATQRPTGAVSDNIRANTNLRIALRVQDRGDSTDVIGTAAAEGIGRSQPGRAYIRLGPGEIVPIQTALATATTGGDQAGAVDLADFHFGATPRRVGEAGEAKAEQSHRATDLVRLVDAVRSAFAASGTEPPRRPWPDPLPIELTPAGLAEATTGHRPAPLHPSAVPMALADDPDAQARYPVGWVPADGNLLLFGIGGSGTTTALATLALALAERRPPDDLHLYVLDYGAGELAPLAGLPHVGAVVGAGERERQVRLVRWLRTELDRRRQLGVDARRTEPDIVVLLDGLAGFRAEFDDVTDREVADGFTRLFGDGPEVGIRIVATADRAGAAPGPIAALVRQKWLFRLADPHDYGAFGVSHRSVPTLSPGRAVVAETGQLIQLCRVPSLPDAVTAIAQAHPPPTRPPAVVGVLPTSVAVTDLLGATAFGARPWLIPLGIAEGDLAPSGWALYDGEHALVAGPARSGKSTALGVVAEVIKASTPEIGVAAVAGPRSPLGRSPHLDATADPAGAAALLAEVATHPGRWVVLIDDAETIEDGDGAIAVLLAARRPDVHVIAAGRADSLRTLYTHWTKTVRASKMGFLLRPDADLDGDLLGVRLPRRAPVALTTGRGYLVVGGDLTLVQLAGPPGR